MITRTCTICKETKEYTEFQYDAHSISRISVVCKKCKWNYMLKHLYGITTDDYDRMYNEQGGRCAICGQHQSEMKKPLCVDHDHITKIVRGLLCNRCNIGLGFLGDNVDLIKKALKYLEK